MSTAERPLFLSLGSDNDYPVPTNSTTSIESSSSPTTSSVWSRKDSTFSNKSYASHSSASSVPSGHTAARPFDRWQAGHNPSMSVFHGDPDISDLQLPCEFLWLDGCTQTFALEDLNSVQLCIEHIQETHLKLNHPHTLSCWWCDDVFDAKAMDIGDGMVLFHRMEHIRDHVVHGEYSLRRNPRRQDFHMLDFLWRHGLIKEEVYGREYYQSEMPLPEGMLVCDAGQRPRKSLSDMVVHNNDKEERMRRREKRKEKVSRSRR